MVSATVVYEAEVPMSIYGLMFPYAVSNLNLFIFYFCFYLFIFFDSQLGNSQGSQIIKLLMARFFSSVMWHGFLYLSCNPMIEHSVMTKAAIICVVTFRFVLLKEKNMLLTMEHECDENYQVFPNPERIDKVEVFRFCSLG